MTSTLNQARLYFKYQIGTWHIRLLTKFKKYYKDTYYKFNKNMPERSISGQLNKEDKQKILSNTIKYGAIALLVFLSAIQNGVAWQQALYLVYLWLINVCVDFLTKFTQGV